MKTKLISLIVIVSIVAGGFIFLPAFRGSRGPEETEGYGPDILMWGKSISLQEAVELAPFPIILPENIPSGLRLVDVRIMTGAGCLIGLVYRSSELPENAFLRRDVIGGGILVIEGYHGATVEYTEQLIKDIEEGKYSNSRIMEIEGRLAAIIDAESKKEVFAYNGELIYDIVASPKIGTDELIRMATSIIRQMKR